MRIRLRRRIPNHMYYVYVLKSESHNTRYIGSTADVDTRLKEHNSGKCKYTASRVPWKLIYQEKFATRAEAMQREKSLKSGKGREYLDNLLPSGVV